MGKVRMSILLLCAGLLGTNCMTLPKDYVTDDKVVFLKQRIDLDPIAYPIEKADPFEFSSDVNLTPGPQSFLKAQSFEEFLRPDTQSDQRFYKEATLHFETMLKLPLFISLKKRIDELKVVLPPIPSQNHGDKVTTYTNGASFQYPDDPGSTITILNTGDWFIDFADHGTFQYFKDGSYVRTDSKKNVLYQWNAGQKYSEISQEPDRLEMDPSFKCLITPDGTIEYSENPEPQYRLQLKNVSEGLTYVYFPAPNQDFHSCAIEMPHGVRIDYFPEDQQLLVTSGNEAISFNGKAQKYHTHFDTKTHKATGLISEFLPEGIRLANLEGPEVSYSVINPNWPIAFLKKTLGPFDIFYVKKDESLIQKLSAAKLTEIESNCRKLSGLSGAPRHSIIVPPDLESYRRFHALQRGEVLNWYPSGFEMKDFITMWPFSVPRYKANQGQQYFFDQEIYEIISHEYTHILVGENSGIINELPVWLNEGLAVYVESNLSAETKHYWEVTFQASVALGKLLPWDDVTVKSTGEFPVGSARVHYAQSFALISALAKQYGTAKIAAYVRSFWNVKKEDQQDIDLLTVYKKNFKSVFGVSFEKALELLAPKK